MSNRTQTPTDISAGQPLPTAWGWILAYGLVVCAIGLIAWFNPVATGLATGVILAALLFVYGTMAVFAGLSSFAGAGRWVELLSGVVAVAAGVLVAFNPFAGAVSLVWLIGAWLIVAALVQLAGAATPGRDRGWRIALGLLDLVLGALLLFSGAEFAFAFLAVAVGFSFIFRGVCLIVLALALRRASTS